MSIYLLTPESTRILPRPSLSAGRLPRGVTGWYRLKEAPKRDRRAVTSPLEGVGGYLDGFVLRRSTAVSCLSGGEDRLEQARRRHGQLGHAYSGRMVNCVGHRGHRRHDSYFAGAARTQRMVGIGYFDHDGFYRRQIQTGWHPVIKQGGVA